MNPAQALEKAAESLSEALGAAVVRGAGHARLQPARYARAPHTRVPAALRGERRSASCLLGMNPGPFGMAQTGVPFGEVAQVRDWLGIDGAGRPSRRASTRSGRSRASRARAARSAARGCGARCRSATASPSASSPSASSPTTARWCSWRQSGKNLTPDKLAPRARGAVRGVRRHLRARVARSSPSG